MRTRPWMLVPLAALLASAAQASGPEAGRWSMSLSGGADMPFSGDVHDGAVATVPDLGPLNPALAGINAELRIGARSHDRIYGNATTWGLEFAYGLNDRAEMFGQIRQTEADRGTVQVGGAYVPALATELPVMGTFDDFESMSAEIGYRHYFGKSDGVRPFVAARIGATRTERINATFVIEAADITIANAPFFASGWSASGGVDLGVLMPVGETFNIVLSTGVRYAGDLKEDDRAIAGLGLAKINNTGSRMSYPVTATLRWNF